MSNLIPNVYTLLIIITFLSVIIGLALFINKKSTSLKKIINYKKRIKVTEYLPIRGGFSAYIFSIDGQDFLFIGHKSGQSNLTQILNNKNEDFNNEKIINEKNVKKQDIQIKKEQKPLQHVNISDLLALHKKG